jgi:hypothetical protein
MKLKIISDDIFRTIDKNLKKHTDSYISDTRSTLTKQFKQGNISKKDYDEQYKLETKKIIDNRNEINADIYLDLTNRKFDKDDFMSAERELKSIGLLRTIDLTGIETIVKNVQDKKKLEKFSGQKIEGNPDVVLVDMYFGIHLHNFLRLSRSEASRTELWNSLALNPSIIKYVKYRSELWRSEPPKLKKNYFFTYGISDFVVGNHLARPWWATELSRNGKDYSTSIDAFLQTEIFIMRWNNMDLMHNKLWALTIIDFFSKTKFSVAMREVRLHFRRAMNDYAASGNFNVDFSNNIKIDHEKFKEWQDNKYDENKIEGPGDFIVSKSLIKEKSKIFKDIAKLTRDTRGNTFIK